MSVAPGLVTTISFAPAVPAGVLNRTDVADKTVIFVAATPPTVIPVVPVKLSPVSMVVVPPDKGPWVTLSESASSGALQLTIVPVGIHGVTRWSVMA